MSDPGGERRLDDKPGEVTVTAETQIVIETPGAGGYGHPLDRSPEAVGRDVKSGKYSATFIERHYAENAKRKAV